MRKHQNGLAYLGQEKADKISLQNYKFKRSAFFAQYKIPNTRANQIMYDRLKADGVRDLHMIDEFNKVGYESSGVVLEEV